MYKLHEKMRLSYFGDGVYHVFNGRSKEHYKIGKTENDFLQQLWKEKTFDELLADNSFGIAELDAYLKQIENMNFFTKNIGVKIKFTKLYLFSFDTSKWKKNKLTVALERVLFSLFIGLMLIFISVFLLEPDRFIGTFMVLHGMQLNWQENIIIFIVVTMLSYIIHELAHALTAINSGIMVPEIGGVLYFFSPVGYADVTGLRFLNNKMGKYKILIAGLITNIIIALASFFVTFLFGHNDFFQNLLYSNLLIVVFNLCYFLKLDGYYLLEVVLDEPGLREKSLIYIRKLLGLHKGTLPEIKIMDKFVYAAVGIISMLYLPLLFGNMIIRFAMFIWGRLA